MKPNDDLAYFSEEHSADVVNARIDPRSANARLAAVITTLTRHLHACIKEIEPTRDECLAGNFVLAKPSIAGPRSD